MKSSVWLKLVILIATLGLVVWASVMVRKGSMEGLFATVTGPVGSTNRINLCPNRIHAFIFPGVERIEEHKEGIDMKWMAHDQSIRPLNYLAVEKWLGEHCYVEAKELKQDMAKMQPFNLALTIELIDQSRLLLMQNTADPNVYSVNGRFYESPDLTSALGELRSLAGW